MTPQDHVVALFTAANPAPDPDKLEVESNDRAHLDTVEQWSQEMSETIVRRIDPKSTAPRGRGWSVGIAAAVALIVGIGMFAILNDDPIDPATAQISAIETAVAAYNDGDVDGWIAAWDPQADEVQRESWGYFFEILMNANEQLTFVEPCAVVNEDPVTVECTISYRDDFHGPAEIGNDTEIGQFTLNTDLQITVWEDNRPCCAIKGDYTRAFNFWLSTAHPGVYEQIMPVDNGSLPGWRTDPLDMVTAIQYVEEFVAQSDEYPLTTGG